jgi:hypothetical protein
MGCVFCRSFMPCTLQLRDHITTPATSSNRLVRFEMACHVHGQLGLTPWFADFPAKTALWLLYLQQLGVPGRDHALGG